MSYDKTYKAEHRVPYAVDMTATLFQDVFTHLHVEGDETMRLNTVGVSTSYLYFGTFFLFYSSLIYTGTAYSPFPLHIEDKGLCSINYGHFGAPKKWYGTAQKDYGEVVKLLMGFAFVLL
jgi:hypothetical protein